jgi:DNA-binding NarL/FixJ family response regulator
VHRPKLADQLTPQETQVARLAVECASNRQATAPLSISLNTVDDHLVS